MPQAVGLLLLAPFDAAGIAGLGTLGASTISFGVLGSTTVATAVGISAIAAAPVGCAVAIRPADADADQ